MPSAPPDAAVARFRADLLSLCPDAESGSIGLAVSGGPDSLALLLLANAAFGDVRAATVDHGLRPESADEAIAVATLCQAIGVPHTLLSTGPKSQGNLQNWARTARYAALSQWQTTDGIPLLLTAHHADDQLETLLMRLNRGAGVGGMAGIRAWTGSIARPLLGWRKTELIALVANCGVEAANDPSNRDPRFDRARMRVALAEADWLDRIAAVRTAAALAEADLALDWAAQAESARRITQRGSTLIVAPEDLPDALLRRLILSCITRIAPDATPRGPEMDRLLVALKAGATATLAGVQCSGGADWRFKKAPSPRKN